MVCGGGSKKGVMVVFKVVVAESEAVGRVGKG